MKLARPCFALLGLVFTVFAEERGNFGRSMVTNQQGIVSTSQTLASQADAQILGKSGSAVDAAIVANAVLGIPNP